MDIQAKLEAILHDFTEKLRKAARDTIGEVETEYLPYLEGDWEGNVRTFAESAVEDLLAGRPSDLGDLTQAQAVRDALYRDHKAEIIAAIGKDLEGENKYLREELERYRRRAAGY